MRTVQVVGCMGADISGWKDVALLKIAERWHVRRPIIRFSAFNGRTVNDPLFVERKQSKDRVSASLMRRRTDASASIDHATTGVDSFERYRKTVRRFTCGHSQPRIIRHSFWVESGPDEPGTNTPQRSAPFRESVRNFKMKISVSQCIQNRSFSRSSDFPVKCHVEFTASPASLCFIVVLYLKAAVLKLCSTRVV